MHDMAHDLTRLGLGKIGNDDDLPWCGEWSNDLSDLKDELLSKGSFIIGVVGEFTRKGWLVSQASKKTTERCIQLGGNKGIDSLTSDLVGDADDGSLSDVPVKDQSGLDLSGGETVTRGVGHV